jgi:hypothetical protein
VALDMNVGNGTAKIEETQEPTYVVGALNYLGAMDVRPEFYVYDQRRDNLNLISHESQVRNGRTISARATLEKEGFCLVEHRSSVVNLQSRRAVLQSYCGEIESMLRDLTGAPLVIAEPIGIVRSHGAANRPLDRPGHRPIRFVHTDHTERSALWTIQRAMGGTDIGLLSERRWAVYNVWRALTPPPQDMPLALCDARSVEWSDAIAADTVLDFPNSRSGRIEATLFRFNAKHRWYYFPNLTRDEVLVFKGVDSAGNGCGHVPHTAFIDPTVVDASVSRTSLDLRAFAIY